MPILKITLFLYKKVPKSKVLKYFWVHFDKSGYFLSQHIIVSALFQENKLLVAEP